MFLKFPPRPDIYCMADDYPPPKADQGWGGYTELPRHTVRDVIPFKDTEKVHIVTRDQFELWADKVRFANRKDSHRLRWYLVVKEYRPGLKYYQHLTFSQEMAVSNIPNLRDLKHFSQLEGMLPGMLFRGGAPFTYDTKKLAHIFKRVMQLRTIIDLRGEINVGVYHRHPAEQCADAVVRGLFLPQKWDGKAWIPQRPTKGVAYYTGKNPNMPVNAVKIWKEILERQLYYFPLTSGSSPINLEPVDERCFKKEGESSLCTTIICKIRNFWRTQNQEQLLLHSFNKVGLVGTYMEILITCQSEFKRLFELLLEVQPPILFIGALGKDRVGLVSMLLLNVLGADDEEIISDYCASDVALDALRDDLIGDMGKLHLDPEFALAEPETMRNLLIAIKERWTSITEYFEEAGLTREQLTTLRNKFTYESANIQAHSQTEDLIDKAAQARHEATVVTNDQQTKKRSVRSASFEKIEKHLQDPESEVCFWNG
eukprot:GHVN01018979.1.p1 GENE.GHVN01018979.1~~GHVN01018979.1.p1  ORF type:complete len:485 (-),score=39.76 GHVN01018979.1:612-2066(-)